MWSQNVPSESSISNPDGVVSTEVVRQAVSILRDGGLVALPTETVYGLGARADRPEPVRRIFAAKGRPADHPLIAHIAGLDAALELGVEIAPRCRALLEAFWPGPLTVVVSRPNSVVLEATGGLDSVALRAPQHPLTERILASIALPIVAPSANRFGRVSPTTAAHVAESLGDAVDLIVDGGSCRIGVESSIIDIRTDTPVLLRPGGLSLSDIESVVGPVARPPTPTVAVPGTLAAHYAPNRPLVLMASRGTRNVVTGAPGDEASTQLRNLVGSTQTVGLIGLASDISAHVDRCQVPDGVTVLAMFDSPEAMGAGLYQALRDADHADIDVVVAWLTGHDGIGAAIDDRLRRASVGSPPLVPHTL